MRTIADTYIEEGINIGKNEGIAIGEARGEARGKDEGIKQTAINMLRKSLDTKLISSVTGLSPSDISKLRLKLN